MNFPNKVIVTDQVVDLSKLNTKQKEYYIELSNKIKSIYLNSNKNRLAISLGGPSGTGKSVVAEIMKALISNSGEEFDFHAVDLDAFHFSNEDLEKSGLIRNKGRYDTYDISKLVSSLHDFISGHNVTFPTYSRKTHNPEENGFCVTKERALLLVVGLWMNRDDEEWKKVREYITHSFSVKGPQDKIKKNTIERHVVGGRSLDDAESFYNNSDLRNTEEILNNSIKADEEIEYYENIQ